MVRMFVLFFCLGLLGIFIIHNTYQTSKSMARCEALIAEIHQYAENLDNL